MPNFYVSFNRDEECFTFTFSEHRRKKTDAVAYAYSSMLSYEDVREVTSFLIEGMVANDLVKNVGYEVTIVLQRDLQAICKYQIVASIIICFGHLTFDRVRQIISDLQCTIFESLEGQYLILRTKNIEDVVDTHFQKSCSK